MHVPQDSMWWKILKNFGFLGELNKAQIFLHSLIIYYEMNLLSLISS